MSAKSILGGRKAKSSVKPRGSARSTEVSGYVQTKVARECRTCEYVVDGIFCRNPLVRKDPKVVTDPKTGRKVVDPIEGCCNEWYPGSR